MFTLTCNPTFRSEWRRIRLYYVHTFRFSPGREVPLIAGQSSGTQESIGVFTPHNPVVWPAGNLPAGSRVAPGSIHYYVRSPAGRWVSSGACVAYRHVRTLRFLAGCIQAINFHCSVSSVETVVKMGDFEFDTDLLISLVEARPVLWDKTDDIYKDRNETKKAWREVCICLH